MRSFYLFKRASGIYYVHYRDPVTKSRVLTRSTGKKDHAEAQEKAIEMLVTDSSLLELRKSSQLTQLQSLIKKRSLSVNEAAELQFTLNQ